MSKITITEALAEIPTIAKRITKKEQFIKNFLFRQSAVRDPHEKDGGSALLIERELQSIADLQQRVVDIRSAIIKANAENTITIGDQTNTIADWLTWRREIAPKVQQFYKSIADELANVRKKAQTQGVQVTDKDSGNFSADFIVNLNEKKLQEGIEKIEVILGTLDGQLSLKNATIVIDI